jgi:RNA polymerase sigma-70 factor (ECF subfamily)
MNESFNAAAPEPPDADGDLVRRLQAGEPAAYEQAVRSYTPRMLAVARRFLQHEQDAQDAVQDAFLSAFRGIDEFQQESRLATWLHRIVVNASLMKLRARKRQAETPIEDLLPHFQNDGHLADRIEDWAVTHDTAVQDRELRELIRRSIDALPESYRAILLLRDIEGHNTEEAADLLGLSVTAAKTRLHRARQALRTLLDPHLRGAAL